MQDLILRNFSRCETMRSKTCKTKKSPKSQVLSKRTLKTLCPYMVMFLSFAVIGWFAGNCGRKACPQTPEDQWELAKFTEWEWAWYSALTDINELRSLNSKTELALNVILNSSFIKYFNGLVAAPLLCFDVSTKTSLALNEFVRSCSVFITLTLTDENTLKF